MAAMARRLAYGGGGGVDKTIAPARQGRGDDGTRPAQGKARAMQ